MPLWLLALGIIAAAGWSQRSEGVTVHASSQVVRWMHSAGAYAIEHPADWKAHEHAARTNIGSDEGLVPTERSFRTIYGVIIAIVDDPLAGAATRSLVDSSRAIVDNILTRNTHFAIEMAIAEDKPVGGAPAYRAVLGGISPLTGHHERGEVFTRPYDSSRLLNVIFACAAAQCAKLAPTFAHMRDSLQVRARPEIIVL